MISNWSALLLKDAMKPWSIGGMNPGASCGVTPSRGSVGVCRCSPSFPSMGGGNRGRTVLHCLNSMPSGWKVCALTCRRNWTGSSSIPSVRRRCRGGTAITSVPLHISCVPDREMWCTSWAMPAAMAIGMPMLYSLQSGPDMWLHSLNSQDCPQPRSVSRAGGMSGPWSAAHRVWIVRTARLSGAEGRNCTSRSEGGPMAVRCSNFAPCASKSCGPSCTASRSPKRT